MTDIYNYSSVCIKDTQQVSSHCDGMNFSTSWK